MEETLEEPPAALLHRDNPAAEVEERVIEPAGRWPGVNWGEIWRYRELLYFLTWRDVKVRYKQTVLGAAWAILQPLMTMVVFSIFFGKLAGLGEKTGGIPYPIYVYAGLLPWTFFASCLGTSSNSLVNSAHLISKVYFPRLIIPFSAVIAALVDFGLSFGVMLGLMVVFKTPITLQVLLLPVFLAGLVLVAAGVGSFLAALTVAYRDFRYVVPFMVQLWMFVSPVIYPPTIVPERWRWVLSLNPLYGLIDGFRVGLLGGACDWSRIGLSLLIAVGFFFVGAHYFRSVERRFADVI